MKRKARRPWIGRGSVTPALLMDGSVDPFLRFTPRTANLQTSVVMKVLIPTNPRLQQYNDAVSVVVLGTAEMLNHSHRRRRA